MTRIWPLPLAPFLAGLGVILAVAVPTASVTGATASVTGPAAAGLTIAGAPSARLAPDFTLTSLDGRSVRLSHLRGKVVVLNFWATWCAPCKVETPWLVEFYQRYQSAGLEIVGVSMDDGGPDRVAEFINARHVNYPILMGSRAVAEAYGGVRFLPQTFFVGRDGRIIEQTFGIRQRSDFEQEIRQALGLHEPSTFSPGRSIQLTGWIAWSFKLAGSSWSVPLP